MKRMIDITTMCKINFFEKFFIKKVASYCIEIIYWHKKNAIFLIYEILSMTQCTKTLYRFQYVCVGSLFRSIEYYKQ